MNNFSVTLRKTIKIVNVVTTADLKQKVDISSFNNYKHLSSNLDLYRCGYVKDEKMVGRVTVFGNGKLISVGTKSPNMAEKELLNAVKILKKNKLIKNKKIFPLIQNIVANVDLEKTLNLIQMAKTFPNTIYEPERFAGLVFHMYRNIVALIFSSGKINIVGTKSIEELNESYFQLEKKIDNCPD